MCEGRACINHLPIPEEERLFRGPTGSSLDDHPA
jgi:nuclear transport factor 2 (NTF2) superfamily protein